MKSVTESHIFLSRKFSKSSKPLMFDHHEYSATHTALLLCRILLVLISKEGLGPWHTMVFFISCYSLRCGCHEPSK